MYGGKLIVKIKRIISLLIIAIMVTVLFVGCGDSDIIPEIFNITAIRSEIMRDIFYLNDFYDDSFYVHVKLDITHPLFNDIEKDSDEIMLLQAIQHFSLMLSLVIERESEPVYVIHSLYMYGKPITGFNVKNEILSYENAHFDFKTKRLTDVAVMFLIPEKYINDNVQLVFTNGLNYGFSGVQGEPETAKYTEPEDIWLKFNDFEFVVSE